jgi:hypothetical protein
LIIVIGGAACLLVESRAFPPGGRARRPSLHERQALQDVVDVVSEEKRQQQTSDATNPEEKMLGQFWGIDLFLVHE